MVCILHAAWLRQSNILQFNLKKLKEGHETHFARVTEKMLSYLINNSMPAWEVPNILAKYYTTTKALELALKQ